MKYQVYVSGEPKAVRERVTGEAREAYVPPPNDPMFSGGTNYGRTRRPAPPHTAPAGAPHPGGDGATRPPGGPQAGIPIDETPRQLLRRFPPVLQFLTRPDALVEQQMETIALQAHRKGMSLKQICQEVYYYARSVGYEATLGVQEVYSGEMPSFPGQTVMSALLLVDLKRILPQEGYHQGRVNR